MIGIIPAAGAGERIQPLGYSKELLPVGSRMVNGVERPKAVAEYLVERMIAAGARADLHGDLRGEVATWSDTLPSVITPRRSFMPSSRSREGLCDALFRAEAFARHHDQVLIGLPDTIWFPENAFISANAAGVSAVSPADVNLVLFPAADPSQFDAVITDDNGYVSRVEVKQPKMRIRIGSGERSRPPEKRFTS